VNPRVKKSDEDVKTKNAQSAKAVNPKSAKAANPRNFKIDPNGELRKICKSSQTHRTYKMFDDAMMR
jgi:hypothetical protein